MGIEPRSELARRTEAKDGMLMRSSARGERGGLGEAMKKTEAINYKLFRYSPDTGCLGVVRL
jgi:hypothetical protein